MELYPSYSGAVARDFEQVPPEVSTGFDNWLNDYLNELLPASPAEPVAGHGSLQAMPNTLSPEMFDRPPADADMAPPGQEIASSNSGDYSNEAVAHNNAQHNFLSTEDHKAAQRAARVADKNRYAG
jgi:hypothetical protein